MKLIKSPMDLFEFKKDPRYYFAHCIGADARMGAGIAVRFTKEFPGIKVLRERTDLKAGTCVRVGKVFNLITKEKSRYKPNYEDFTKSLEEMKKIVWERNIGNLAMPKIGCGLDQLEWVRVEQIIRDLFCEIGALEIMVCVLPDVK